MKASEWSQQDDLEYPGHDEQDDGRPVHIDKLVEDVTRIYQEARKVTD